MAEALIQPSLAQDANLVALARLPERITYLDVSPVVTHDIDRVPASALPHLADQFHMRHTVAWRRATTDAERRALVKAGIVRHRIKGTLAGFRLAAKDAGAELVGAITPPAKLFAGAGLTAAERNAFVARYPQLRIYRYRNRSQRVGAMLHACHAGASHFCSTTARERIAPRAMLWRAGVVTALRLDEESGVASIVVPGTAGRGGFCGTHARFAARLDAAARSYRVRLSDVYQAGDLLRRIPLRVGLEPIDVRYDLVAEPGVEAGLFAGRWLVGTLRASTARDRLYQRLYLFDADVAVTRREVVQHLNQGRLSLPAFHAELAVRIRGRAHPGAAWRFVHGCLVAQPRSNFDDCMEAMRDVARGADRIAINTVINRPAAAGEHNVAGALLAGAWIDN